MKLEIRRNSIVLVPQQEYLFDGLEEAFIEDVLGLKRDGDWVQCRRVNAMGLSCIAYLEIAGKIEGAKAVPPE